MSRTIVIVGTVILVGTAAAFGRELPKLECDNPQPGDRYSYLSSIAVVGNVTGLSNTSVKVRLEHVSPDGKVLTQAGVDGIRVNDAGVFAVTLLSPAAGWLSGKNRMVVQLDRISHVMIERDFEVVLDPNQPRIEPQYKRKPTSAGVTIDPRKNANGRSIPVGKLFLVRGEFSSKPPADPLRGGPRVFAKIVQAGATMRNNLTDSLWDAATNQYWYELQLQAPAKKGLYFLELHIHKIATDGTRSEEKLQIPIIVTDEDPLAGL